MSNIFSLESKVLTGIQLKVTLGAVFYRQFARGNNYKDNKVPFTTAGKNIHNAIEDLIIYIREKAKL